MKIRISLFIVMALGLLLFMVPGAKAQKGAGPCCSITKIDTRSGVVSAVVKQSGESFEFKVADANLLKSFKVGQGVYANFATHLVSVDGIQPCCNIISLAPVAGGTILAAATAAGKATGQVNPAQPCCNITAVNTETGIVAAKENTTGQMFSFRVSNAHLLNSLKIGQRVYANFANHQVSVNGIQPCCSIISHAPVASEASVAAATTAAQGAGQVNPAAPCCSVTGVNTQTGIVAAKEDATGRIFSFKVTDAHLLKSFKVGQGVYANFATHLVSVDGIGPCCNITTLASPGPLVGTRVARMTLTAHDHTLIVKAVLENRATLRTQLKAANLRGASRKKIAVTVLAELLKLDSVDSTTKSRIRLAKAQIEKLQLRTPAASDRASIGAILTLVRGQSTTSAKIAALDRHRSEFTARADFLQAIDLGKSLLQDGAATIYSPEFLRATANSAPTNTESTGKTSSAASEQACSQAGNGGTDGQVDSEGIPCDEGGYNPLDDPCNTNDCWEPCDEFTCPEPVGGTSGPNDPSPIADADVTGLIGGCIVGVLVGPEGCLGAAVAGAIADSVVQTVRGLL